MAIPSGYSLLGRIGYNDRGVYSENNEYVRGDVVYHEGSSYVALTTVTGIAPTDDNTNWKYLARGFVATELSEIDATDTSGFVGDAGTKVKGQTLIDKIAEYVMSKVVATDAFQTYLQKFLVDNCVTERSDLSLSAAQGKALQDQLATLNSNLSDKQDKIYQPLYRQGINIDDWNNVFVQGWYSGYNLQNAPTPGWVCAINIPYNGDGSFSCLIATNGVSLYIRYRDGVTNTWTGWREFATK